ncbi:MAG: bifunctional isocitrate dehydrogenase kinase/phosphatase [Candidatus Omnitrophica bacterium]|nr:bifunctional isocitrate dehydrogenase kinase/phosphatase [Candidatus Omnitrophota bacterium]
MGLASAFGLDLGSLAAAAQANLGSPTDLRISNPAMYWLLLAGGAFLALGLFGWLGDWILGVERSRLLTAIKQRLDQREDELIKHARDRRSKVSLRYLAQWAKRRAQFKIILRVDQIVSRSDIGPFGAGLFGLGAFVALTGIGRLLQFDILDRFHILLGLGLMVAGGAIFWRSWRLLRAPRQRASQVLDASEPPSGRAGQDAKLLEDRPAQPGTQNLPLKPRGRFRLLAWMTPLAFFVAMARLVGATEVEIAMPAPQAPPALAAAATRVQEHESWFMDAEDSLKEKPVNRRNAARAYMRGFLLKVAVDDLLIHFRDFAQGRIHSRTLYARLADDLESVVLKEFEGLANAPTAVRAIRAWIGELRALARQTDSPPPALKELQQKLRELAARMPIKPHPSRKERDPQRRPVPFDSLSSLPPVELLPLVVGMLKSLETYRRKKSDQLAAIGEPLRQFLVREVEPLLTSLAGSDRLGKRYYTLLRRLEALESALPPMSSVAAEDIPERLKEVAELWEDVTAYFAALRQEERLPVEEAEEIGYRVIGPASQQLAYLTRAVNALTRNRVPLHRGGTFSREEGALRTELFLPILLGLSALGLGAAGLVSATVSDTASGGVLLAGILGLAWYRDLWQRLRDVARKIIERTPEPPAASSRPDVLRGVDLERNRNDARFVTTDPRVSFSSDATGAQTADPSDSVLAPFGSPQAAETAIRDAYDRLIQPAPTTPPLSKAKDKIQKPPPIVEEAPKKVQQVVAPRPAPVPAPVNAVPEDPWQLGVEVVHDGFGLGVIEAVEATRLENPPLGTWVKLVRVRFYGNPRLELEEKGEGGDEEQEPSDRVLTVRTDYLTLAAQLSPGQLASFRTAPIKKPYPPQQTPKDPKQLSAYAKALALRLLDALQVAGALDTVTRSPDGVVTLTIKDTIRLLEGSPSVSTLSKHPKLTEAINAALRAALRGRGKAAHPIARQGITGIRLVKAQKSAHQAESLAARILQALGTKEDLAYFTRLPDGTLVLSLYDTSRLLGWVPSHDTLLRHPELTEAINAALRAAFEKRGGDAQRLLAQEISIVQVVKGARSPLWKRRQGPVLLGVAVFALRPLMEWFHPGLADSPAGVILQASVMLTGAVWLAWSVGLPQRMAQRLAASLQRIRGFSKQPDGDALSTLPPQTADYLRSRFGERWDEALSMMGDYLLNPDRWPSIDQALANGLSIAAIADERLGVKWDVKNSTATLLSNRDKTYSSYGDMLGIKHHDFELPDGSLQDPLHASQLRFSEGPVHDDLTGLPDIEGQEAFSVWLADQSLLTALLPYLPARDDPTAPLLLSTVTFELDDEDRRVAHIGQLQAWLQIDRLPPTLREQIGSIEHLTERVFRTYAEQRGFHRIRMPTGSQLFDSTQLPLHRNTIERLNNLYRQAGYRLVRHDGAWRWEWEARDRATTHATVHAPVLANLAAMWLGMPVPTGTFRAGVQALMARLGGFVLWWVKHGQSWWAARQGARAILNAFDGYQRGLDRIAARASERFERREWSGVVSDDEDRVGLYYRYVLQHALPALKQQLGERFNDPATWKAIKEAYTKSLGVLKPDIELAQSFFNSAVSRAVGVASAEANGLVYVIDFAGDHERQPSALRELVTFLDSILPARKQSHLYGSVLYTGIGYYELAKRFFYQELRKYLRESGQLFRLAAGWEHGSVMGVFTLPGSGYVFKIIKDPVRQFVKDKYRFVREHDRVGRMLDASTYENLRLEKRYFSEELLEFLLAHAAESVSVEGDFVLIKHVYVQREVTPLQLYLEQNAQNPDIIRRVLMDFGNGIKDLMAAGIFPGEVWNFKFWNFGVTSYGRVVLYDYDDLQQLTAITFKHMLRQLSVQDDDTSNLYYEELGKNEIVLQGYTDPQGEPSLEEFFAAHIPEQFWEEFQAVHGDLFSAGSYYKIQEQLRNGQVPEFFAYPQERRFLAGRAPADSSPQTQDLIRRILADYRFRVPYEDLDRDVQLAAGEVETSFRHHHIDPRQVQVEMVQSRFYRNRGAFLIGRFRTGSVSLPFVLALTHPDGQGITVDAVLLEDTDLEPFFSSTRSSFRVQVTSPLFKTYMSSSVQRIQERKDATDPASNELNRRVRTVLSYSAVAGALLVSASLIDWVVTGQLTFWQNYFELQKHPGWTSFALAALTALTSGGARLIGVYLSSANLPKRFQALMVFSYVLYRPLQAVFLSLVFVLIDYFLPSTGSLAALPRAIVSTGIGLATGMLYDLFEPIGIRRLTARSYEQVGRFEEAKRLREQATAGKQWDRVLTGVIARSATHFAVHDLAQNLFESEFRIFTVFVYGFVNQAFRSAVAYHAHPRFSPKGVFLWGGVVAVLGVAVKFVYSAYFDQPFAYGQWTLMGIATVSLAVLSAFYFHHKTVKTKTTGEANGRPARGDGSNLPNMTFGDPPAQEFLQRHGLWEEGLWRPQARGTFIIGGGAGGGSEVSNRSWNQVSKLRVELRLFLYRAQAALRDFFAQWDQTERLRARELPRQLVDLLAPAANRIDDAQTAEELLAGVDGAFRNVLAHLKRARRFGLTRSQFNQIGYQVALTQQAVAQVKKAYQDQRPSAPPVRSWVLPLFLAPVAGLFAVSPLLAQGIGQVVGAGSASSWGLWAAGLIGLAITVLALAGWAWKRRHHLQPGEETITQRASNAIRALAITVKSL